MQCRKTLHYHYESLSIRISREEWTEKKYQNTTDMLLCLQSARTMVAREAGRLLFSSSLWRSVDQQRKNRVHGVRWYISWLPFRLPCWWQIVIPSSHPHLLMARVLFFVYSMMLIFFFVCLLLFVCVYIGVHPLTVVVKGDHVFFRGHKEWEEQSLVF